MSESQHPALRFVAPLKDLAEGRTEPDAWLAWWAAHADEVEAACPRGWFLKLKPKQVEQGAHGATHFSQQGAFDVLGKLNVAFVRSDRYLKAWQRELQQVIAAEKTKREARGEQFEPVFAALAKPFPKIARFLKTRVGDIDRLDGPASEQEVTTVEQSLGAPLPEVYRSFLRCTKRLSIDGLALGLEEISRDVVVVDQQPQKKTIRIGEYWLEGDGDQVLLAYNVNPATDPPVYYYAHAARTNTAREIAPSVSAWIESLPKSPLFRE